MNFILKILENVKDYKKLAWVFIIMVLALIMLYPIIDTNFLYYSRISNRINILEKVSKIDENKISKNKKLNNEYNSIIKEISEKENNYLNNIFITETSRANNLIKFIAASWMFIIIGIILLFTKDKVKKKITMLNIVSGVICIGFAILIGYLGVKIPTIINIIIYNSIMIFFAYTIISFSNKNTWDML